MSDESEDTSEEEDEGDDEAAIVSEESWDLRLFVHNSENGSCCYITHRRRLGQI